jgi:hypothetical protein
LAIVLAIGLTNILPYFLYEVWDNTLGVYYVVYAFFILDATGAFAAASSNV